jgi:hypothetical protein
LYCSAINDFPQTNKMAEKYLNTNEIALEKVKAKELNENKKQKYQILVESMAGLGFGERI